MIVNYVEVFRNWSNFSGRARRSEYWYFTLANFIVLLLLEIVMMTGSAVSKDAAPIFAIPYFLYALAVIVPSFAVAVRRLHDIGKSGWWILIGLVPLIGGIILLVWACTDSEPGDNRYGPNPKTIAAAVPA